VCPHAAKQHFSVHSRVLYSFLPSDNHITNSYTSRKCTLHEFFSRSVIAGSHEELIQTASLPLDIRGFDCFLSRAILSGKTRLVGQWRLSYKRFKTNSLCSRFQYSSVFSGENTHNTDVPSLCTDAHCS